MPPLTGPYLKLILLDLREEEIRLELQHGREHSVRTTWLIDFIHVRSLNAREESYQRDACHGFLLLIFGTILFPRWLIDFIHVRSLNAREESYQCDACHGFLLLIFGTILFPHSSNLIDGALAQVVLQVVGGHSYVEAVLAETIRSLDYVREVITTGVTPLPDSSTSQDGGRRSRRYFRRSQPFDPDPFSTTADTRPATSYFCRRTPGILRRPSDASPTPGTFRGASPTGLTNIRRHQ
ncbi:hypothetical protein CDL15_Pgr005097 [Punica granatum]|uniref:Uncharacterized protein n=1 Tax=Punica granatum TaxID=22663 RepID=A0A218WPX1_PUNGR|nr:hypothetical protein CDL15_Pgr005097 [Punica granatum]